MFQQTTICKPPFVKHYFVIQKCSQALPAVYFPHIYVNGTSYMVGDWVTLLYSEPYQHLTKGLQHKCSRSHKAFSVRTVLCLCTFCGDRQTKQTLRSLIPNMHAAHSSQSYK